MIWKDWYIMVHMGTVLMASTVFVFMHPEHFVAWSTLVATIGAVFHWIAREAPSASTPS